MRFSFAGWAFTLFCIDLAKVAVADSRPYFASEHWRAGRARHADAGVRLDLVQALHTTNATGGEATPSSPRSSRVPAPLDVLDLEPLDLGSEGELPGSDAQGAEGESRQVGVVAAIVGSLLVVIASSIQWFNEERSARIETLLVRGLAECMSVDAAPARLENRGRLVHVQGRARGALPVSDVQFKDVLVKRCLRLQSTVEAFEWVQTTRAWLDSKEIRSQARFHAEWTTIHQDSGRFRKPSPDNPRLPSGMMLGTFTSACPRVEIGEFVLPERMVSSFHKFEPAMAYLPPTVSAGGLTFHANQQDGYYYARPGVPVGRLRQAALFSEHQVGDLRARFIVVPETDATVVAVQCPRDEHESFVPYRVIPRAPCLSEHQERQKLIEEGDRPLKDLRGETACCTGGVVTCCCCPCNALAICCKTEVVTEEIFHVSDQLDPIDKPFRWVVTRSPWRVWGFRLVGWAVTFVGTSTILGAVPSPVEHLIGLAAYGRAAGAVFSTALSLTLTALITAAAYALYRPTQSLKWIAAAAAVAAAPGLCSRLLAH